eukprot:5879543-Pleurochrysis_carterae.AAC.3
MRGAAVQESELAHEDDLTSRHISPAATYIRNHRRGHQAVLELLEGFNIYVPTGRVTPTYSTDKGG